MSDASRTSEPPAYPVRATPTRGRDVRLVAMLSITETISWGIVYYAFAVF